MIWHIIWHMRTTLDLDDGLMEALLARFPGVSKTKAIEEALRRYLARESAEALRRMAGRVEIEDVSAELRRLDRR